MPDYIGISKALAYAHLFAPEGISISKGQAYSHLHAPEGLSVSKAVVYSHLSTAEDPPIPNVDKMDIEVVRCIIDSGLQCGSTFGIASVVDFFHRSAFHIDTDDLDGTITYTHEIIALNNTAADIVVTLHTAAWDDTPSQTVSQITVPANTSSPKLFTAEFSPLDGLHYYHWTAPIGVEVYKGRVRTLQINGQNFLTYRPLADDSETATEHFYQQFASSFLSHTQKTYVPVPGVGAFVHDTSLYSADSSTYKIEVNCGSSVNNAYIAFCLWDETLGIMTPGTEFTVLAYRVLGGNSVGQHASIRVVEIAEELLTDGHVYRLYWKVVEMSFLSIGKMYGARLYHKLSAATKVTVYYRLAMAYGGTAGDRANTARTQINVQSGNSRLISAFNESCAQQIFGTHDYWVQNDNGNLDGGGADAVNLASSNARVVYPTGISYAFPFFSDPFHGSIVDGNMYFGYADPVTDSANGSAQWTLAALTYIPSGIEPPPTPPEPEEPEIPDEPAYLQPVESPINPEVMLQYSDDGGFSWSQEYRREVGRIGEFSERLVWDTLGSAKNRVFKIAVSDPCKWIFTGAYIKMAAGVQKR